MQDNDSFSSFYARISAQTALCNWPIDQERETLKDLLIGRIRDVEVQRQLIRAKANLEDTLQLALENEKRAKTSEQFQKLLPHNNASSNTTSSIRVKQEPTSSVQQFKNQGNRSRGGGVNRPNQRQNQNKSCYFCGIPFSLEHRRSCPAREATCNACKTKGHFAKVCNTTKRRVNMVQNEEMSSDQECNLIDVNGESEPENAPKFSKIEAIKSLLPPKTLKQLKSFMGTLNHLQRFIPDLHKYTVTFKASLKAENKKSFLWGE